MAASATASIQNPPELRRRLKDVALLQQQLNSGQRLTPKPGTECTGKCLASVIAASKGRARTRTAASKRTKPLIAEWPGSPSLNKSNSSTATNLWVPPFS